MGREIRMVPPNWEHPKKEVLRFTPHVGLGYVMEDVPMYDKDYATACADWKQGLLAWEGGGKFEADNLEDDGSTVEYWDYEGMPPDKEYYRPWKKEDATWFQLWQTVSEGSPVSPPFATREELAGYLAENGDFWDQSRGVGGWGKERADAFVKSGWAPSMMMTGGCVFESKDIPMVLDMVQPK